MFDWRRYLDDSTNGGSGQSDCPGRSEPARVLGGGAESYLPVRILREGEGERNREETGGGRRWWPNSRRFLRGGDGGWGGEEGRRTRRVSFCPFREEAVALGVA